MKRLNTYVNEWKINDNSIKKVDNNNTAFIYHLDSTQQITIISPSWPQFDDYYDKIYDEHGNNITINGYGRTNDYKRGTYRFFIRDIDKVKNCQWMFIGCEQLVEVPLFDTSKVETMNGMFNFCYSLENIPNFNTINVTNMEYMLQCCYKLKLIPNFNTKNVVKAGHMFAHCTTIAFTPKFDFSNMCSSIYMFDGCSNLKDIPLFDNNTNFKYVGMRNMFKGCEKLSEKTKREWSQIYDFIENEKIK